MLLTFPGGGRGGGWSGSVCPHMTCSGASVVSLTLIIDCVTAYLVLSSAPIVYGYGEWRHWCLIMATLVLAAEVYTSCVA